MTKSTKASKKVTKAVAASALGIALLAGGSTYALWNSSAGANTAATITTGDLKVTAAAPQQWADVTASATGTPIDLSTYRLAPGSTVQVKQKVNTVVVGNNITGILDVRVPNTTTGAALAQAKYTIEAGDTTANNLGTFTANSLGTNGNLSLNIPNLKPTGAAGKEITVTVTVQLPESADNATKNQMISLSNMEITLNQGPAAK